MLVSYLRHQFGIRNIDSYLDLYSDMRGVYEMTDDLDTEQAVASICSNLQGKIRFTEGEMLLLRLMEFCGVKEDSVHTIFKVMAETFGVNGHLFRDFVNFVAGKPSTHVILHQLDGFDGQLKTLIIPTTGVIVFTYTGSETVLLNDVPVLSGSYQVLQQSSVLKGKDGHPVYYSTILDAYNRKSGKKDKSSQRVEFCGRDINFRFPNSDNGMHNLSFNLHSGELLAIMGGSGTGKSTLLSILNGSLKPQEGTITINGHDISEPGAKDLIGFVYFFELLLIPLGPRHFLQPGDQIGYLFFHILQARVGNFIFIVEGYVVNDQWNVENIGNIFEPLDQLIAYIVAAYHIVRHRHVLTLAAAVLDESQIHAGIPAKIIVVSQVLGEVDHIQ